MYDLIVIGGGPAGFFAAIWAKQKCPKAQVLILEKTSHLLFKVKISGGGRCNVTNAIYEPKELAKYYPRGQKELISAFYQFNSEDMIQWLENKGVKLKVDKDKKVFPKTDDSMTIVECLLNEAKKNKVEIKINQNITKISKNKEVFEIHFKDQKKLFCKKLLLTTGSQKQGYEFSEKLGHSIQRPIPSLFAFKIKKSQLQKLSGISQDPITIKIKDTSFKQIGPILLTHEGFSGPAVINLSAYAAKYLYEKNYKAVVQINWINLRSLKKIEEKLLYLKKIYPSKKLINANIFNFSKNLWNYFLDSFKGFFDRPLKDVTDKHLKKLSEKLFSDSYQMIGKSTNKQEFVTCGGVTLKEVNFKDMQSKICKGLYFAGEILDIDGITGGFNFQNTWTTGFIAGSNI